MAYSVWGIGYSNDYTNRNIVLTVFVIFYFYLRFIFSQLQRSRNWKGIRCNPLEMVVSSIFDSENSNKTFQKCMQYPVSTTMEEKVEEYSKNMNNTLDKEIRKLTKCETDKYNNSNISHNNIQTKINSLQEQHVDDEIIINDLKLQVEKLREDVNTFQTSFKNDKDGIIKSLELSNN